jgi:hypothetical protein
MNFIKFRHISTNLDPIKTAAQQKPMAETLVAFPSAIQLSFMGIT